MAARTWRVLEAPRAPTTTTTIRSIRNIRFFMTKRFPFHRLKTSTNSQSRGCPPRLRSQTNSLSRARCGSSAPVPLPPFAGTREYGGASLQELLISADMDQEVSYEQDRRHSCLERSVLPGDPVRGSAGGPARAPLGPHGAERRPDPEPRRLHPGYHRSDLHPVYLPQLAVLLPADHHRHHLHGV